MTGLPRITTFGWVPPFARGFVRDVRVRWAFEEVGQAYAVDFAGDAKGLEHRRFQPFGQVPTYCDDAVEIFETGAIVLRIAERAGRLIPASSCGRWRAIQWLVAALNSVEPALMGYAQNELFEADRPWADARRPLVMERVEGRFRDLEAWLAGREWLEEDGFTVGDLMMVSSLGQLRGTDVLAGFPALAAYVARGEGRPAHRKAMADHLAVFDQAPAPAEPAHADRGEDHDG